VTGSFACALCGDTAAVAVGGVKAPFCERHGPQVRGLLAAALRLRNRDEMDGDQALALVAWPPAQLRSMLIAAATSTTATDALMTLFIEDAGGQLRIEVPV
jgi:hypothetical protein